MSKPIAEALNGFDALAARQIRGHQYRVLSWRNESVTAHKVDLEALTCTCEVMQYSAEDNEICDHLATALYQAPQRITIDETAPYYLSECVDEAQEAVEKVDAVTEGLEESLVSLRSSEAEAAGKAAEIETTETQAQEVTKDMVEEWLDTGFAASHAVDIREGSHSSSIGIILEPDNQAMSDPQFESFKALMNSLEDSTVHVGFGDDPCNYCSEQDGQYYYHVPADDSSEVWA